MPEASRAIEFRKFLNAIEAAVPKDLDVHTILDNYGTHKTPAIHRWLLKRPRFRLHFTRTSASWINLVERWFGKLTEQQIRRGVHRSTDELVTDHDLSRYHQRASEALHLDQDRRRDLCEHHKILFANFKLGTLAIGHRMTFRRPGPRAPCTWIPLPPSALIKPRTSTRSRLRLRRHSMSSRHVPPHSAL